MSAADSAISAALSQTGVKYGWGKETPGFAFDCSGLIQYAFGKAGISLPRTSQSQQSATKAVSNPLPGDLVFYGSPAHHVGLYLGAGKMIAAPHTGDVVKVQDVYSAADGPTYGRVPGAGVGGSVAAVGSAVNAGLSSIGSGVSGAVSGAVGSAVRALEPIAVNVGFVGLGLALIGGGFYIAAVKPANDKGKAVITSAIGGAI